MSDHWADEGHAGAPFNDEPDPQDTWRERYAPATLARAEALARLFDWAGTLTEQERAEFAAELETGLRPGAPWTAGSLPGLLHERLVIEAWEQVATHRTGRTPESAP